MHPGATASFSGGDSGTPPIKLAASHINFRYGREVALTDVSVPLYANRVTALIGPSGCGKSTLLRVFNRMHDLYRDQHVDGKVLLDGVDILGRETDIAQVRRRVGMVFQQITAFPMSIYDNVAFGIRSYERPSPGDLADRVERALQQAALWEEVKDILQSSAMRLSGGQQQRLCVARAIAMQPEVLLLDEPCSALDPISAAKLEETIDGLKANCTVAIVTHNLQQALRMSDHTAFMYLGRVVEFGATERVFSSPQEENTGHYVNGRFG